MNDKVWETELYDFRFHLEAESWLAEQRQKENEESDMKHRRYLVTIHYREPTYDKHTYDNVVRLRPFTATYEVICDDEERAKQLAQREFQAVAIHSSVGWVRQIVKIECDVLGDDVICKVMGE